MHFLEIYESFGAKETKIPLENHDGFAYYHSKYRSHRDVVNNVPQLLTLIWVGG